MVTAWWDLATFRLVLTNLLRLTGVNESSTCDVQIIWNLKSISKGGNNKMEQCKKLSMQRVWPEAASACTGRIHEWWSLLHLKPSVATRKAAQVKRWRSCQAFDETLQLSCHMWPQWGSFPPEDEWSLSPSCSAARYTLMDLSSYRLCHLSPICCPPVVSVLLPLHPSRQPLPICCIRILLGPPALFASVKVK